MAAPQIAETVPETTAASPVPILKIPDLLPVPVVPVSKPREVSNGLVIPCWNDDGMAGGTRADSDPRVKVGVHWDGKKIFEPYRVSKAYRKAHPDEDYPDSVYVYSGRLNVNTADPANILLQATSNSLMDFEIDVDKDYESLYLDGSIRNKLVAVRGSYPFRVKVRQSELIHLGCRHF